MIRLLALLTAPLLAVGIPSGFAIAAHAAPSGATMAIADYCADTEELAFLTLINDYRAQHGKAPLVLVQTLGAASEYHSVDMATKDYFAHTLRGGATWSQNMANHGYGYNTTRGENIAAGYETAAATFTQWKTSAGHNANMLNDNYSAIGVGRAYDAGSTWTWYWTTDFGGVVDATARCGGTPDR